MKRWLTFILLLITLSGTVFPCCLADDCKEEETVAGQNKKTQEPDGNCSPFFACATCGGFTAISNQPYLLQLPLLSPIHDDAVFVFDLSTYTSSFWQPPRFA